FPAEYRHGTITICDQYCQTNQGHHARIFIFQLTDPARNERPAAIEENKRREREQNILIKRKTPVNTDKILDHRRQNQNGNRDNQGYINPFLEITDHIAMIVVAMA